MKKFNENVEIFLKKYKLISKIFPVELTNKIMNQLDPRKDVHQFGRRQTYRGVFRG